MLILRVWSTSLNKFVLRHRSLLLLLSLLSTLPFNFMVGYPFSSFYTTNCLWGQIRELSMSILVCGIFVLCYRWIVGFGVLYFTVGKLLLFCSFSFSYVWLVSTLVLTAWYLLMISLIGALVSRITLELVWGLSVVNTILMGQTPFCCWKKRKFLHYSFTFKPTMSVIVLDCNTFTVNKVSEEYNYYFW